MIKATFSIDVRWAGWERLALGSRYPAAPMTEHVHGWESPETDEEEERRTTLMLNKTTISGVLF
jgi:hypothetical protein